MKHPFQPGWLLRNVQGRAIDREAGDGVLRTKELASVVLSNSPRRIVRRCCHHTDVVSACRKPLGHLTRVLSDTGQFRCEVEPVDKDAQSRVPTREIVEPRPS